MNIFRRLLGRCDHDWNKWTSYATGQSAYHVVTIQKRTCKKCGLLQYRRVDA